MKKSLITLTAALLVCASGAALADTLYCPSSIRCVASQNPRYTGDRTCKPATISSQGWTIPESAGQEGVFGLISAQTRPGTAGNPSCQYEGGVSASMYAAFFPDYNQIGNKWILNPTRKNSGNCQGKSSECPFSSHPIP